MDIFQQAARQKLRFSSSRGELTVEQLFDLPLQSRSGFDLDTVAKGVNRELKGSAEESFVAVNTPANARLTLMLDVVKSVIETQMAENAAKLKRAQRAEERQKLLGLLANKQDQELQSLSVAEITAKLAALDD